jgi:HSP20 family protein
VAESKLQTQSSEQQRGLSRRQDFLSDRELFSFSPFAVMRRLTEEMDRAFGSAFGLARPGEYVWAPVVEARERGGNFEVSAELPGLTKDEVKVECTENGIVIQGERKREHESEEGGVYRSERHYGRFHRLIPLPEGAEPDKAKAEFKNGVLQVQVPMSQQAKPKSRQVPIS